MKVTRGLAPKLMNLGTRTWGVLAVIGLLALVLVPALVGAYQTPPAARLPLDRSPEPQWPANEGLRGEDLASTDSMVDEACLKTEEAQLLSTRLMTYAHYCASVGEDPSHSPYIAPGRLVRVVQILWPGGFEHPKVGLIRECLSTAIYDAETGAHLGSTFHSQAFDLDSP